MSPENNSSAVLDRIFPVADQDELRVYDQRLKLLRGIEIGSMSLSYMMASDAEFDRIRTSALLRQIRNRD